MIHSAILNPDSIVVVGASNDTGKPGGKVLKNILENGYDGYVYAVNPKETKVQGIPSFAHVTLVPQVDLAIIAIAAQHAEETIRTLALEKNCKGFILFSAGFSEIGEEGKALEKRCVEVVESVGGTLIGPNCIGILTRRYKGVFAGPIPEYDPMGCDCVSASGATMVFIMEQAIPRGLRFSTIFSIGNGAQIGIEDVLEYWDLTFDPERSSRIKLLYLEEVHNPAKFLKHARSLSQKGCKIAAIKAGITEEGSRAVSSHTGSLAGSSTAVGALFRKAGIVRCYSRIELVYVACVFAHKPLQGNRLAIVTHAGGPGILLTDILTQKGMKVPRLEGEKAQHLLAKLNHGSSVANPIDFLATGTAEQLGEILDFADKEWDDIDGTIVVFGTTGMWNVNNVYEMLHKKMQTCRKPIFPILPSTVLAAEEVQNFQNRGRINFTDEVILGYVLARIYRTHAEFIDDSVPTIQTHRIREIIDTADSGYLSNEACYELLQCAGISTVQSFESNQLDSIQQEAKRIGFPIVMKVVGPIHKSDVGGVQLNIQNEEQCVAPFHAFMKIPGATGVFIQQQISGTEVFIGAKEEYPFGHLVLCGLGGIFIEVFKDTMAGIVPVGKEEALNMIRKLKSYPVIQGIRGKEGIDEMVMADTIGRVSALLQAVPEIQEMDINPLLGKGKSLVAVDARIRIEKAKANIH